MRRAIGRRFLAGRALSEPASLVLNRGRKAPPWSGRHLALGIEPVCSPFGLGPETARADNPLARSGVATALDFAPDQPFTTRYRIEAEPL